MIDFDISKFQREAYEIAVEKGWHESDELANGVPTARQKLHWLALITDELDEARIEIENGRFEKYYEHGVKPCGLTSEYADALVRIGDQCGACGWKLANDMATFRSSKSVQYCRNTYVNAVRNGDLLAQNALMNDLFWSIVKEFYVITVTEGISGAFEELFSVIAEKMAYNKTRSRRHGGKLA